MTIAKALLDITFQNPQVLLWSLFVVFISHIVYSCYIHPTFISPLRLIPGPPSKSKYNKYNIPFLGLHQDTSKNDVGIPQVEWVEKYGGVIQYSSLFNSKRVFIADPAALQHVLNTNVYNYKKHPRFFKVLEDIIGEGLLLAEGDVHRRQRKMANPAFGLSHIKETIPLMSKSVTMLVDIWKKKVGNSNGEWTEYDVYSDFHKATLDVLGHAAFGYDFKIFSGEQSELSRAFDLLDKFGSTLYMMLYFTISWIRHLPLELNKQRIQALEDIKRITFNLINDKRGSLKPISEIDYNGEIEESKKPSKDLMSILIRANESGGDGKLSDTELKDQIMTIIAAGHDTTTAALAWMMHELSKNVDIQTKLRNELLTTLGKPSSDKTVSYEELNGLPYLNACVKELFRLYPTVPIIGRVAIEDDCILGYRIPKGTRVITSPATLHRLKSVYGEDADEFIPERWIDPSKLGDDVNRRTKYITEEMQRAYMPFLMGPRTCIGSKFATLEVKLMTYHLLTQFEFRPVPGFKFRKVVRISLKPSTGMRLGVRLYKDTEH